jgi:tRNA pseudouridine13 synthase
MNKLPSRHVRGAGRQVRVGDCEEVDAHLHSGELRGNRFVLAIRNITARPHAVRRALAALRDRGFLNYFGMQR